MLIFIIPIVFLITLAFVFRSLGKRIKKGKRFLRSLIALNIFIFIVGILCLFHPEHGSYIFEALLIGAAIANIAAASQRGREIEILPSVCKVGNIFYLIAGVVVSIFALYANPHTSSKALVIIAAGVGLVFIITGFLGFQIPFENRAANANQDGIKS